jgi:hypothetical protein
MATQTKSQEVGLGPNEPARSGSIFHEACGNID